MRAAIVAMMILLLPAALLAGPTMGVYFSYNPGQMHYNPMPFEQFTGYVYGNAIGCYLNAVEFRVATPPGIVVTGFVIPEGSLSLGDPVSPGLSITYWPPMDGWNPGYNLLCKLNFLATQWCYSYGGTLMDAPLSIVPHLETGMIQGSCWPENTLFHFAPMTSIICPDLVATQDKSWGAIKSLF